MRNRSLPPAGAALILTLAGFGLAGPASAAPTGGANATGPYTSCEALLGTDAYPSDLYECPAPVMSANGQGKAPHLAGSKGKADDKNPPGQRPDAKSDGNNGYECDGNSGIAKGNPAHSECVLPVPVEDPEEEVVVPE